MKTLFTAVISVLLVSLFHTVRLSNPDSEIVQNTSLSDVSHDQKRSAPMRMEEDNQERSTYFSQFPKLTKVTVVEPVRVVERLAPRSGVGIISSISYRRSYVLSNSRGDVIFSTYDESSNGKTDKNNRPVAQNVYFTGKSSRNPSYFRPGINTSSVGVGYSSNLQPSSSSNSGGPYGSEVNGRPDQNFRQPFYNGQMPPYNPRNNRPVIPNVSLTGESSRTPTDFRPGNNTGSLGVRYPGNFQPQGSSNGAGTYGNEESNRRDQNIGSTFLNGHILPQNALFNFSTPVFSRNESIGNFGPNRESPQLPINPTNTPSNSPINRGVFNGNEGPSSSTPVPVTFDAHNPERKISPDLNLYASFINDFGFKLIETMNLETNFVLSPLSIFLALSMCYLGSDGTTKDQLQEVMGLTKNAVHDERFHQGMKDLISSILPQSTNYELYLANGLFLGKNFKVKKEFKEDIKGFYEGQLENLDFRNPQSVSIINEWVARMTRNMIPRISESAPSPLTRLLVLNAIFFKGIWKTQFPPKMTFQGAFFSSDGSEKIVPTMPLHRETFPFYRSEEHGTSFLKLPYEGDEVSLMIALPLTMGENPMPSMTDEILCHVRDTLNDTTMDKIAIPKFRFGYTQSLKRVLEQLGITHLFNPYTANFGKMTPENVSVSEILQKAVIDINEQGTSASASTSLQWVGQNKKKTTDFIVNHPFAFYIVHERTGLVLFNGKIFDIGQRRGEVLNNPRGYNTQEVPENTPPVNVADRSGIRGY